MIKDKLKIDSGSLQDHSLFQSVQIDDEQPTPTMKARTLILNSGILKNSKQAISFHHSTIMAQDNLHFINPEPPLILNRTCANKELIFNPALALSGKFDADLHQRWLPVKHCYY
jgi:hypothetical protein